MKKLLLVVNVDWFFLSHWLPIAQEAQKKGFEVIVTAVEEESKGDEIRNLGFIFETIPGTRGGTNIIGEIKRVFFFNRLYKKYNPDIVHHFSIKNNLYGSLVARITKVPKVVNTVTGLGSLFYDHHTYFSFLKRILRFVFMFGFRNKKATHLFENSTDRQFFEEFLGLKNNTDIINGAGVDLSNFVHLSESGTKPIKVVLAARILKDKGVMEFERAAAILKLKYQDDIDFILAGKLDSENISAVSVTEMNKMQADKNIRWIGNVDNMPKFYQEANIITLPSYREGLSKSLIEACAVGRPIVTTDAPGCRDVINEGKNGFTVPVRDHKSLAEKIEILYLNKDLRDKMGAESRKLAEEKFALEKIVAQIMYVYES